jgi:hypothetical protein
MFSIRTVVTLFVIMLVLLGGVMTLLFRVTHERPEEVPTERPASEQNVPQKEKAPATVTPEMNVLTPNPALGTDINMEFPTPDEGM